MTTAFKRIDWSSLDAAGKTAAPVRGGLGWYVVRVNAVKEIPARTLASTRVENWLWPSRNGRPPRSQA